MIAIQLANGRGVVVVDEEDADLSTFRWHRSGSYASGRTGRRKIGMHRLIVERVTGRPLRQGETVDHIDGDPLNNRRGNLRSCSQAENNWNRGCRTKGSSSGYKGVCIGAGGQRWRVNISVNGKYVFIGEYESIIDAAVAYDRAAVALHGRFARTNYPPFAHGGASYADERAGRPAAYRQSKSGYRGVVWHVAASLWQAKITINKKGRYVGFFKDKVDAAKAYDVAASKLYGAKARLNFPDLCVMFKEFRNL